MDPVTYHRRVKFVLWAVVVAIGVVMWSLKPKAQESYDRWRSWTEEEKAQIHRYYEPISVLNRSSHWHDWDCCQSYRCFPARVGSVKWTPSGIAVRMPDGAVRFFAENDAIWKAKKAEGVNDPRAHICFEVDKDGNWVALCGYKAGVQG